MLLDRHPEIRGTVIRKLVSQPTAKQAADLVKYYKFNHLDFPELLHMIAKNSSCYFIGRAFRAPDHEEHMPIHRVEDLFTDHPLLLFELISSMLKKGLQNEAKGVWHRHCLEDRNPPILLAKEMDSIDYEPSSDPRPKDVFGPLTVGNVLTLPSSIKVRFISKEADIDHLKQLVGQAYIGMDSEWRP